MDGERAQPAASLAVTLELRPAAFEGGLDELGEADLALCRQPAALGALADRITAAMDQGAGIARQPPCLGQADPINRAETHFTTLAAEMDPEHPLAAGYARLDQPET